MCHQLYSHSFKVTSLRATYSPESSGADVSSGEAAGAAVSAAESSDLSPQAASKKAASVTIKVFILSPILSKPLNNFINSNVINKYKFDQIASGILNLNASSEDSFGNIIAEFNGINSHFYDNFTYYLTGKGIGSGIPDYKSYLSVLAGAG